MTASEPMEPNRGFDLRHPPKSSDVDELIGWINEVRRSHSDQPLADLIDTNSISVELLVELACVDLIALRRSKRETVVEDYLQQFPSLGESQEYVLDLVDAELCVRRELGDNLSASDLSQRFPKFADSIRQLAMLEGSPDAPGTAKASFLGSLENRQPWSPGKTPKQESESSATIDFANDSLSHPEISIAPTSTAAESLSIADFSMMRDMTIGLNEDTESTRRLVAEKGRQVDRDDSIDVTIPIQPPTWMSGARCIATHLGVRGRCWLVKGRDIERSDSVAMKIMPVPTDLDRETRTSMLDFCERTSNVHHDSWVAPRIAAINNGHIAIIRPWVFGHHLASLPSNNKSVDTLQALTTIGYSLSAAHRTGATHGNVSPENVIIDHESQPCLVDAGSSVSGWNEYWPIWNNKLDQTLPHRIQMDSLGLLSLISSRLFCGLLGLSDSADPASGRRELKQIESWLPAITKDVSFDHADACIQIGENLQSLLDGNTPRRRWWKS